MKTTFCISCPRKCPINRQNQKGFCQEGDKIRIAKIIPHFKWEEPCLSDESGTLAIFFSGCNLQCDYCQNYQISRGGVGKKYTIEEFVKLIESFQDEHSSIDLVTPTHFTSQLCKAFDSIDKKVPVIWNSNSYENVDNLEKISRFVDIFLADLKYADDQLGKKYSKVEDYNSIALPAIKKMCSLKPNIEENGFLKQGVIIRHLVLPTHIENSFKVLDQIKEQFPSAKISLMSQFTPNGKSQLNRKISKIEYKAVISHLKRLGLTNGYIQGFESAQEEFVPNFEQNY